MAENGATGIILVPLGPHELQELVSELAADDAAWPWTDVHVYLVTVPTRRGDRA